MQPDLGGAIFAHLAFSAIFLAYFCRGKGGGSFEQLILQLYDFWKIL
jgi:hypothetical protein